MDDVRDETAKAHTEGTRERVCPDAREHLRQAWIVLVGLSVMLYLLPQDSIPPTIGWEAVWKYLIYFTAILGFCLRGFMQAGLGFANASHLENRALHVKALSFALLVVFGIGIWYAGSKAMGAAKDLQHGLGSLVSIYDVYMDPAVTDDSSYFNARASQTGIPMPLQERICLKPMTYKKVAGVERWVPADDPAGISFKVYAPELDSMLDANGVGPLVVGKEYYGYYTSRTGILIEIASSEQVSEELYQYFKSDPTLGPYVSRGNGAGTASGQETDAAAA